MNKGRSKTHTQKPLAPGTSVDAPYPFQQWRYGEDFPGYIVRWRARREFFDKAVEIIPDLLPSLLTEDAIRLALEPAHDTIVTYDASVRRHARMLERALFSRNDRLFEGVDWNEFDPHQDPRVSKLTEYQQMWVQRLGEIGIAVAWQARSVTREDLGLPVWQVLTMYSRSESEGQGEIKWLRTASPNLWRHIRAWAVKWQLDNSWVFMVATATICDAAGRQSIGSPVPSQFIFPKNWEDWYINHLGKLGGPGLAKRPQRRRAHGDHMNWLIQRHFMNRTAKEIGEAEGVRQQTVDQRTRRLARLIHMNMSRAQSGRPRRRSGRTIKHRSKN